ncbi:MAG TPA: hypothetical protein VFD82_03740 [Planctomycetota bacterium]|nr:hypothetical protein [Planctomycetota bacterium]
MLVGVLDSFAAAQFLLPVRGFSATQLAFSPVPHPALRVGEATLPAPDPLLCSASYVGADVEQLVFAVQQGGIVLLDASSSLALYPLTVPAGTWSTLTGVCIDREKEQIVLLDAAQPSFLRIDCADLRAGKVQFSSVSLPPEWSAVRGIAFDVARDRIVGLDPATGNLLQYSATSPSTNAGELRRLPAVGAFGFAPTLNLSQSSGDLDLFVTWGDQRMLTDQWTWNAVSNDDETGTLIASVNTSLWVPPSPDPSGVAYDAPRNRLVITDSEVDEMSIYAGVNVYETSRTGVLARTTTTVGFTIEPAGLTFDAVTKTYYLSDDDADQIWVIGAGPDTLINTLDDTRRFFKVDNFCPDAEGLAWDNGTLWIAGGISHLVHRLRPGPNGIFDGTSPNGDDVLASFDIAPYGVTEPSGVALRSGDGGIHVLGIPKTRLLHLNKVGQLVRVINLPNTSMIRPQGIVFAPSTVSTEDSLFLVDRGHDNDLEPLENDGEFREYGMPAPVQINMGPVVNAGPDVTMAVGASAQLAGIVEDDGLPSGTLTRQWSKLSGPGTASFTAPTQAVTNVSFSAAGTYTLRLSASDSVLTNTDTVVVDVAPGALLERTVAASWDDAEEQPTAVVRSSTDLEMVVDGTMNQVVGIRFLNLTVPPGATIASAYVQFTTDEAKSVATQLTIAAEASDNAATFQTTALNISSRPRTTATVPWAPPAWAVMGEAGVNQRTPELATLVQQVVNRPTWVAGNALVLVITGTGCRNASSFDRNPTLAPKLVLRYATSAVNQAPIVNAGPDVSTSISSPKHLAGSVIDDGLPGPLTIQWTKVTGPGTATFTAANQEETDVTFSLMGTYTLQLSASDGAFTRTDTCVVTVTAPVNQPPVVNAGPDVTTQISSPAHLVGTVADDGLNSPLTIQWSKLTGPGTATFTPANQAATDVTFSTAGSYTLELSVADGQYTVTDTVVVTVQQPAPPSSGTVERTVAASDDDAEESPTAVVRSSTDLELVVDGTVNQVVGIRFQNLTIPAGATISSAFVQFTTDEATSAATQLTIAGQASDNPGPFLTSALNISSRPRTTATVAWAPAPWTIVNEAGPNQRTPNLASIVQQVVNRPGWVAGNALVFVITGTGVRTASAFDFGNPALAAKLTVNYGSTAPVNQPPVVNAGPDITAPLSTPAHLAGVVTDDGLPGPLTIQWSKLTGPGTATFTAPTQAVTNVTFSLVGSYTLRLSASDGQYTVTDTVAVTVQTAPVNQPPVVNAGPDVTAQLSSPAHLTGSVTDDGLNSPLTIQWSKLTGPGTATFTPANQAVTDVAFSLAGSYTLQLSAFDGQFTVTDSVAVTVQSTPPGSGTVERTIAISDDDAEESATGVSRTSSDLELVVDGTVSQVVGLRFQNLTVPAGATISSAFVQFSTDEVKSDPTQLTIAGEASDNPATFTGTALNISSRPRTTATVAWAPAAWTVVNEAGPNQRTPNLASIVQQVVSRPGWASGNALVFVITGTGVRTAAAFDVGPTLAARLTVNYQSGATNQPPVVNAGPDVTTPLASPAHLVGSVTDDGLPGPLTIQWSKLTGPGTATFTAPTQAVTNVTFSLAGSYTLQLSASDGQFTVTDTVAVTVQAAPVNQPPVVNAGPDVTAALSSPAHLVGTVTDDGLNNPLTIQWSKLTGPGTATFAPANQAVTDVTFSLAGNYTLQLSAFDGQFTVTDTVAVTVTSTPVNQPPVVNAGPDVTGPINSPAHLVGSVTDDGLNNPLTIQWSKLTGPGTATFAPANQAVTDVTFSLAGSYTLQLSAFDGQFTVNDTVAVTVQSGGPVTLNLAVLAGNDDAEQRGSSMDRSSQSLDMVMDGTVNQFVGLRFGGVTIPAGATVTSAYLQFRNQANNSSVANLVITGEASDNAAAFSNNTNNISIRPRTAASVSWAPVPWTTVGQAGVDQRSPDLTSVVQQVVSRPGWVSGNALVFIITGSAGTRSATSFNSSSTNQPKLVITYQQ